MESRGKWAASVPLGASQAGGGGGLEKETFASRGGRYKKEERQVNSNQENRVKKRVVGTVRCHQVAT